MSHRRKVSVIGLGYVGLPVALAFAQQGERVIAFDIDRRRISELRAGRDWTNEVASEDLATPNLRLTEDPAALADADFHIVTVPTPIDDACRPDLRALEAASRTVGEALKKGDIVVYESTVYPGATEEVCVPILETAAGLVAGRDFGVGYSPERINPGDAARRFSTITKVVSGSDSGATDVIAEVYGSVVTAGVHRAPDIKTAEAAKVIENTQRDLNIALMNELSVICHRLGIDTRAVLEAAGTKWNFLPFVPGLVGGHCIGVDPYYLTYRAEKAGYHPQVILAGRRINDGMAGYVAGEIVKLLLRRNGAAGEKVVSVLGVTFKENVPDVRNSKVFDLISELREFGFRVQACDPVADSAAVAEEYGIELVARDGLAPADAVVVTVGHSAFLSKGWAFPASLLKNGRGVIADLKGIYGTSTPPAGVIMWRL